MSSEADDIQRKMASIRQEMDEDVVDLVESARSLLDWKGYVTAHPLLTLGAACALGYALVPKKRTQLVDASELKGFLDGRKVVLASEGAVAPKRSMVAGAMTALAGIALRMAVTKATQHLQNSLSSRSAERSDLSPASGQSTSHSEV